MADAVLVATDGSDRARHAASVALGLLADSSRLVLVTVVPPEDPMLATGTGFAPGVTSAEKLRELSQAHEREGEAVLTNTVAHIGRPDAERVVLRGDAGPALCDFAAELSAAVLVVGSRGLGVLRRAVLGSVSHHVVQHAPCPVLVVREEPAGG